MADLDAVRRRAEAQRKQALTMRYRAKRQSREAEQMLERLFAPLHRAGLQARDLSELDDVRPELRLLPGGRGLRP